MNFDRYSDLFQAIETIEVRSTNLDNKGFRQLISYREFDQFVERFFSSNVISPHLVRLSSMDYCECYYNQTGDMRLINLIKEVSM